MNTKTEYQFIQVPMNLFYTLEGMTRDVLVALIQISNNYANDNGYFFYPIESIATLLNCDKRLVQAGIETLHRNNLVEVKAEIKQRNPLTGGVRKQAHIYRVKFERFHEFEQISISDILNDREYNTIKSVNYKDKNFITYNKTEGTKQPIEVTEVKPKRKYTKKKAAITQQVTVEEEDNKKEATVQQTVQQVTVEDANQDKERLYEDCYDKVEDYKLSDCKDYDEIIKKYLDVYSYLKKNEKELGEENYDKLFSIAANERDKKHDKLKKDGAKKINQSSTKSADKDDCLNNILCDVEPNSYAIPAYAVEKREGEKANLN